MCEMDDGKKHWKKIGCERKVGLKAMKEGGSEKGQAVELELKTVPSGSDVVKSWRLLMDGIEEGSTTRDKVAAAWELARWGTGKTCGRGRWSETTLSEEREYPGDSKTL
ncbi:hypothetical protein DFH08DRAFT_799422 [Mycena albidolilacea]|uniref:Uncharacterized protein n=1 Tax=Mycena albidolilacea TaxID=1033008 RepID=A0AAD7F304_9AGAR|nr:hypothetical protein DFH08DRAFT_799422 [Mycena albidolilacea]